MSPLPPESVAILLALTNQGATEGDVEWCARLLGWDALAEAKGATGIGWDDDAERYRVSNDKAFDMALAEAAQARGWTDDPWGVLGDVLAPRVASGMAQLCCSASP